MKTDDFAENKVSTGKNMHVMNEIKNFPGSVCYLIETGIIKWITKVVLGWTGIQ